MRSCVKLPIADFFLGTVIPIVEGMAARGCVLLANRSEIRTHLYALRSPRAGASLPKRISIKSQVGHRYTASRPGSIGIWHGKTLGTEGVLSILLAIHLGVDLSARRKGPPGAKNHFCGNSF